MAKKSIKKVQGTDTIAIKIPCVDVVELDSGIVIQGKALAMLKKMCKKNNLPFPDGILDVLNGAVGRPAK